ncbi:MAG: hypothetical protein IJI57_16485 [Flexilinea sp.]|nr:hypothetical protein [Flexilinea sp.]
MFPRQNNKQKRNIPNNQAPNNAILEEQKAQNPLLNIGNEAMSELSDFSFSESNEANNRGMLENNLLENNDISLEQSLSEANLEDLLNPIIKNQEENKGEAGINNINRIKDNDGDLVVEAPKRRNLKKKSAKKQPEEQAPKISKNSSQKAPAARAAAAPQRAAAAPQERDEDLTHVDQSMEPVQGWDFAAQKLPARRKQSWLSKLGSWAAYYSGKTIGKLFGSLAWLGKSLWGLVTPGPGTLGGTFKRMRGSSSFKERTDPNNIPGWDGAQFENEEGPQDEVNADFRRVPELWSWPTAEKAAEGEDEDRNAKPRDPVISVYIAQASPDYTVTKGGGTGHTGIGVEYSRYSAKSGRWQRYNLRFGYYIGGGGGSFLSKMAVSSYNNATIPGKLMDEKNNLYDISRSFAAKPKQVSDVLRAAESYADRGGYNQYTRNCTTFAKEMIVDVAKIKGAEGIFAKDEIHLPAKQDAKLFGAGALAPIFKADMENGFEKMRTKDDLDYNRYGSKLATKEDYERYKNSLSSWSSRATEGHSPNASAENMKRAEGGKSGLIGKYDTFENGTKSYSSAPISVVTQQLVPLVSDLKSTLTSITPLNQLTAAGMTQELQELMNDLDANKILGDMMRMFPLQNDKILFKQKTKQSDLVKGRTMMTDLIKKLNTLLFRYYRNDKRVQEKVLNIINVLNHGINAIDEAYAHTEENDLTDSRGELKELQNNYGKKEYDFTVNGKSVVLNASEYEAWLQVYGTPQKALENSSRYYELKHKSENNEITDAEDKEYQKLSRMHNLILDFERSHRYMITKEKYNQQDVDYAFSLAKKEQQGGVESTMFEQSWNDPTMTNMKNPSASAAGTYQMLIMKGVFGGMKDRFSNEFKDKENSKDKNDIMEMVSWLSADVADCVRNHQDEMKTIIRAMKKTTDKPDEAKLRVAFIDLLTKWLFHSLRKDRDPNQYRAIIKGLTSYKSDVMKETDKVITAVMKEQ